MFNTPDYPNTFAEASAMFRGTDLAGGLFNTGLDTIERKTTEPVVMSSYIAWRNSKNIAFSFDPDAATVVQYRVSNNTFYPGQKR